MTKKYNHYCPVAFSLEVIGGKWSLTIIRDLLTKPQRFSDLLKYSSDITPKWLTLTLRQLEESGIVVRDEQQGHREVWYRLTPAGEDLRPVVEAMKEWGLKHLMRPPLPGEVVHPHLTMGALTHSFNIRARKLARPATWQICFPSSRIFALFYDGDRWTISEREAEKPDVMVTVSPEIWASFLAVKRSERSRFLQLMEITGIPERVEEFLQIFGVKDEMNTSRKGE